ncbi:MAG: DUF4390 domain-containing protein [Myxococcales bacterium FL481]|nr:MAG: DUF4390 domain-containing protein [Myxococcales bacterium FL481]
MRRRDLARIVCVLPLLVAAVPETLPRIRGRFIEVGDELIVEFSLPEIIPLDDPAAVAAVDSGFATRLTFELSLRAEGRQKPVSNVSYEARLSWDPWNHRYLVTWPATGESRRFDSREAAVRRATTIRASLGPCAALARGRQAVHFLHIVAHRNPYTNAQRTGTGARGHDRDLSVFARWVSVFLGAPPRAELTVERRTNAFYLVQR